MINVIYEQVDVVSIGSCLEPSCLGPTFRSNIIMTELEIKIVDGLFKDSLLKLYNRFVDDTLALIKESVIDNVLNKLNGFHPSPNFTVDKFGDGFVYYLDLKIIDNETAIYYKDTHTGHYVHFSSYTL